MICGLMIAWRLTLTRCIVQHKIGLLHKLWQRHAWTKQCVGVFKGKVFVRDQARFEEDSRKTRAGHLVACIRSAENYLSRKASSMSCRKKTQTKISHYSWMLKLWVPLDKQMIVSLYSPIPNKLSKAWLISGSLLSLPSHLPILTSKGYG